MLGYVFLPPAQVKKVKGNCDKINVYEFCKIITPSSPVFLVKLSFLGGILGKSLSWLGCF